MKKNIFFIVSSLLLVGSLLFTACNPLQNVRSGQFLLRKNRYNIEDAQSPEAMKQWQYELEGYTKQKPNARALWLPLRLWLYNAATLAPRDTVKTRLLYKMQTWATTKGGEPPVVADTTLQRISATSMRNHLYNEGYFRAKVSYNADTTTLPKLGFKQMAIHNYTIKLNEIYTIDSLSIITNNPDVEDLIRDNTLLKKGMPLTQKNIELERSHIARTLKNNGYYYVAPSSISFIGDTLKGLPLSRVQIKLDTTQKYYQYNLHKISVFSDIGRQPAVEFDTLITYKGISFYELKKPFMKRKILERFFYFDEKELFKIDNFDRTLKRLREIGVYKFTEIKFENADSADVKRIDCKIRLTPARQWDGGYDFDIRNSVFNNQKINIAIGPSFRNKNTFGGAEQLTILLEANTDLGSDSTSTRAWNAANDLNFRGQAELILPRLYIPFFFVKDNEVRNRAKTRYSLDFNRQNSHTSNIDTLNKFNSQILSVTAGWDWYETITKRHQFNPIFIALQRNEVSDNLVRNNEFLKRSLVNQFIIGSNYTFTHASANQKSGFSWLFKGGIDLSGNLTWLLQRATGVPIRIEGTSVAQYARFEPDFRLYKKIGKQQELAFRVAAGYGIPYGLSDSLQLPFNKQFFIGGANSVRAWNIRRVGPGATPPISNSTIGYQTGDSKLEMSAEYRLPITKMIKLATFVDAGNVWLSSGGKDGSISPQAKFDIRNFWDQLAVGAGVGLRLDFSYFLLRGDLAWAVRYPYMQQTTFNNLDRYESKYSTEPTASHWRQVSLDHWFAHLTSPFFNIALGYPF